MILTVLFLLTLSNGTTLNWRYVVKTLVSFYYFVVQCLSVQMFLWCCCIGRYNRVSAATELVSCFSNFKSPSSHFSVGLTYWLFRCLVFFDPSHLYEKEFIFPLRWVEMFPCSEIVTHQHSCCYYYYYYYWSFLSCFLFVLPLTNCECHKVVTF